MSLPLVPDANHPAFPTRSQVDDWEIKRPVPLERGGKVTMAVSGLKKSVFCAHLILSIINTSFAPKSGWGMLAHGPGARMVNG